jgi:hypothetical protein
VVENLPYFSELHQKVIVDPLLNTCLLDFFYLIGAMLDCKEKAFNLSTKGS